MSDSPDVRSVSRSDSDDYASRRAWIADYFDRTASSAWAQLTSEAPVGRIRATVRKGRDAMRATLLSWLPADLGGVTLLDAGCGTGALAVAAAERGAHVVATDLSPTLIRIAEQRVPPALASRIDFAAGDMTECATGTFDYVVAMDSIIHYRQADMLTVLRKFMSVANNGVFFTVAPRTPLLSTMHTMGRLFPRGDRAPAIEPVPISTLCAQLDAHEPTKWTVSRQARIASGFYTSQAIELIRPAFAVQEDLFI